MGGGCTTRGCVFGNCSSRAGSQLGYGVSDDFYRGRGRRGCLRPRGRIDRLKTFGDCCSCHGCKSNNALNVFDQYSLDFDQLFVGWSQNCPCRCGNLTRTIR